MGPAYLISAATKTLSSSMEHRRLLGTYTLLWQRSDKACSPLNLKLVELGATTGSMRERTRRDLDKLQELGWIGLGEDTEFGMNVVLKTTPERPNLGRSGDESSVPIRDADSTAETSDERPNSGRFDDAALAGLDPDDDDIWPGQRPKPGRGVPERDAFRAENGSLGVPNRDAAGFASVGALLSRGLDPSFCHSDREYLYTSSSSSEDSEPEPKTFLQLGIARTETKTADQPADTFPIFPGLDGDAVLAIWTKVYLRVRGAMYSPTDLDREAARTVSQAMTGIIGGRAAHSEALARAVRIFLADILSPDQFVTKHGRLPWVLFNDTRLRKYLDLALSEAATEKRAQATTAAAQATVAEMLPWAPQDFHDAESWQEYVRRLVHWNGEFPSLVKQVQYANAYAEYTIRIWWKAGADYFGLSQTCPWLEDLQMLAQRRADAAR